MRILELCDRQHLNVFLCGRIACIARPSVRPSAPIGS